MEEQGNVKELEVKGIIGFDGSTIKGLIVHSDGKHVIYPIGNKVIVQDWTTRKQSFLTGHTNAISAVAVSRSGKYIASGQINHIGFKAQLIIWSYNELKIMDTHELHKVRVEAVSFSSDEKYCISIGGRDCEQVVVWDIENRKVICSEHVTKGVQGEPFALATLERRSSCFIVGGEELLAVWRFDKEVKRLVCYEVSMPKMRRTFLCIDVDQRDELCFCGTSTGDIVKVRLNFHHDPENVAPLRDPKVIGCFARISKKKLPQGSVDLYENGVRVIKRLPSGQLLIGAGDGTLELVEESAPKIPKVKGVKMPSLPALKVLKSTKVNNTITSIAIMQKTTLLVATTACEIFQIDMNNFDPRLVVTCHTSPIYCVAFPHEFSDVFATASKDDVRVWAISNMQELLRIVVQNFSCSEVVFSYDGKCILTAWNDGIIRSFTPLTGRLMYSIFNAHNKGVSAIAIASHGKLLVSGGCEGQVRLWEITPHHQTLICTLKEHKSPVSAININKTDDEAVSASTDGTCILWDLENKVRRQIMFSNTLFMTVKYYPTSVQILTGGSDRKISYWEILDGSLVREIEGSQSGAINTIDISPCGEFFVSGGNDQIVKLWNYQQGVTTRIGLGHSAVITSAQFSPNAQYIVTTSAAGSIYVWYAPQQVEEIMEPAKSAASLPEEENIKDLASARSSGSGVQSKSERTDSCCYSSSASSSCSKVSICQDSLCSSCNRKKCVSCKSSCKDSKCSTFKPKSIGSSQLSCQDSKCSSRKSGPTKPESVKSHITNCGKC
ncbi:unnamed protein product [Brassicogethes aeneus]|uniref:Cilia- and flagella-associated protein 52 n=1 Tax=Brassicogethes aeneus TaxID=1431903 RepID=A0A9P0AS68_BRAAE|nr:unnamed protein product [Brassicogethes aeneus]